jgi:hypothetical protein
MLASNLSFVANHVPQSTLVMFGAAMGVAVNAIASAPLIKTMWSQKPQSEHTPAETRDNSLPFAYRMKQTVIPMLPYVMGTVSIVTSALLVEKFSFETLLSPVGMCVTNLILTASVGVWSWRRTTEQGRISLD